MSPFDPDNPPQIQPPEPPAPQQPMYPQPDYPVAPYPGQPRREGRTRAGLIVGAVAGALVLCLVACVCGGIALRIAGQGALSGILTSVAPTETALARQLTPTAGGQATCDLTTHVCDHAPLMTINPAKTYIATIETAKGNIVIQLDARNTPIAVNNFIFLAEQRFYDNTYFWRVEAPGLTSPVTGAPSTLQLIQGGSVTPNGQDPADIPGYTFADEPVTGDYTAGDVATTNVGAPNTNGSQFFICTGDNSQMLTKSYTIFGHVIAGLDVARKIRADDIIKTVTIQVK